MKHLSLLAALVLVDLSGSAETGRYTVFAGYRHRAVLVRSGCYGSFCGTVVSGCAPVSCCTVSTCTPCKSSCAPSLVYVSSCVSCGVGACGFSGCSGSAVNADAGAAGGDSAENFPVLQGRLRKRSKKRLLRKRGHSQPKDVENCTVRRHDAVFFCGIDFVLFSEHDG